MDVKKLLSLLVVSACVLVLAACSGVTHNVVITAPDASDLCELYISPAGADAYGANQIAEGSPQVAKSEARYPVEKGGDYDVKIVTCTGESAVMPVNVP